MFKGKTIANIEVVNAPRNWSLREPKWPLPQIWRRLMLSSTCDRGRGVGGPVINFAMVPRSFDTPLVAFLFGR